MCPKTNLPIPVWMLKSECITNTKLQHKRLETFLKCEFLIEKLIKNEEEEEICCKVQ